MNYRELKEELVDLGFEEDSIMTDEEYIRKFASASNRAIDYINTTVRPYVKCVTLKSPGVYDLAEEASDFVDFFEKPKFTENGERKTLGRYFIEGKTKIVLPVDLGDIDVYYKAYATRLAKDTEDDLEIELDNLVLPLIAPLAAYFLWLDDDERKATMYYNIYDSKRQEIIMNEEQHMGALFSGGVKWRS